MVVILTPIVLMVVAIPGHTYYINVKFQLKDFFCQYLVVVLAVSLEAGSGSYTIAVVLMEQKGMVIEKKVRESEEQGPTTMAVVLLMEGRGRKEAGEGQSTKVVARCGAIAWENVVKKCDFGPSGGCRVC